MEQKEIEQGFLNIYEAENDEVYLLNYRLSLRQALFLVEKGDEVLAKLNDPFVLEYVERLEVDELTKAAPIHRKVWVMDQDEHIMILFPEDY